MKLEELILEAVENWRKTGKLPNNKSWQPPEETDSYEK